MGKLFAVLVLFVFFLSFASAEIVLTQQPNELYNLGDTINLPVKVTTLLDVSNLFIMRLLCNGIETEVYKEYLVMDAGEEVKREPDIPLIKSFIGRSTGTCKIKLALGDEIQMTNDFKISDLINIEMKSQPVEVNPGEVAAVEFEATKETGDAVNGFINLRISISDDENVEVSDTVKNGYGYAEFSFPDDTPAGQYLVRINVSEKDSFGETTSRGFVDYNIKVLQVPTSLEIVFENSDVEPDTNVRIKTILHDQSGEPIESIAILTVKNSDDEVIEKSEIATGEFLEVPILYNEPAATWTVEAESGNLTSEAEFEILEKAKVSTEILNRTLVITNVGNVFYNDTVTVKIENTSIGINVSLDVDESKKYLLSAPDGDYNVEIFVENEDSQVVDGVRLTGSAIGIKEASEGLLKIVRHPVSWVFITAVLGFVAFMVFKKGYKRSFLGRIKVPFKKKVPREKAVLRKDSLVKTASKAELSLSIKGEKQNASVVCLKIKNLKEIESKKGNAEETLQKIVSFAEEKKAGIYENAGNVFFILAPVKTKTFSNEKTALEIAQNTKAVLSEHNKMFQQKIDFGISLNNGTIVAKQEGDVLKFMSMGTLMTASKKIASVSDEISLSENIKNKFGANVKTEKHEKDGTVFYTIKEIKERDEHKKFIRNFLDRLEKK